MSTGGGSPGSVEISPVPEAGGPLGAPRSPRRDAPAQVKLRLGAAGETGTLNPGKTGAGDTGLELEQPGHK